MIQPIVLYNSNKTVLYTIWPFGENKGVAFEVEPTGITLRLEIAVEQKDLLKLKSKFSDFPLPQDRLPPFHFIHHYPAPDGCVFDLHNKPDLWKTDNNCCLRLELVPDTPLQVLSNFNRIPTPPPSP